MQIANHIEIDSARCGGKPCVTGTRIRVWDIHLWHNLSGRSPEEIVADYPQLTVADVHASLAYYYDHREEIEQQMQQAEAAVVEMEAQSKMSRFAELRDQLLREDKVDTVSS